MLLTHIFEMSSINFGDFTKFFQAPMVTNMRATKELLLEMGCFYMIRAKMLEARDKVSC
jgi:hypothetical protein